MLNIRRFKLKTLQCSNHAIQQYMIKIYIFQLIYFISEYYCHLYTSRGEQSMNNLNKDILKELIKTFENEFPEARIISPRIVQLDKFVYINDEELDKAEELEHDEALDLENIDITIKEIKPDYSFKPIVAIDTSSAKLGETNKGILAAIRVAIVVQEENATSVEKFGPYVVHVTSENKQYLYDYFRQNLLGIKIGNKKIEAPLLLSKMVDRIRNAIERISQIITCSIIKNGLVLWDGSLTGGTIDTPKEVIEKAIHIAHSNGNSIIAISKKSWLRLASGEQLVGLLDNVPKACFVDVHDKLSADTSRFLGRVHVAKFTVDGFSFRVDVSPSNGYTNEDVFSLLVGNSAFYNGYPEALRLAHIHCYFTPSEVLTLQNYAINKYNLEVTRTFDIRMHLFTPFGRKSI